MLRIIKTLWRSHERAQAAKRFAAEVKLLYGYQPSGLAWYNLGYWQGEQSYAVAAEALARRLAEAVHWSEQRRVLELASGSGAGLLLWSETYRAPLVWGIERAYHHVAAFTPLTHDPQRRMIHGSFDDPELWELCGEQRYTAVLCLDAAYHARSWSAWLPSLPKLLDASGHCVLTTLMQGNDFAQKPLWQRLCVRLAWYFAAMPRASFISHADLLIRLKLHGLELLTCQKLDTPVLDGFAAYIDRRQKELTRRQRYQVAWIKLTATAALARFLTRYQLAHYVLLVLRPSQEKAEANLP